MRILVQRLAAIFILFCCTHSAFSQNGSIQIYSDDVLDCNTPCTTLKFYFTSPPGLPSPYVANWIGPSGFNSNLLNPQVCMPGIYTLILTGANGITASATTVINANYTIPYFNLTSSNPAPCNSDSSASSCERVCPGATVTYYADDGSNSVNSPVKYQWQVYGASSYTTPGNSYGKSSATVTWGASGPGSILLLATDIISGCAAEQQFCIDIVPEPQAVVKTAPLPAGDTLRVCKGQAVQFSSQSQNTASVEWLFDDDQTVTQATTLEHIFSKSGVHRVRLIARSECLCADTTYQIVRVLDAVAPQLICYGTVCPGATVTYKVDSNCPGLTWSAENGTILGNSGDSLTVQWTAGPAGILHLSGFSCAGNGCPGPVDYRIPIVSGTAPVSGSTVVCPNARSTYRIEAFGGTGYQWALSGGGQIVSGQGTPQIEVEWNVPSAPNPQIVSVVYDNCYLGCKGQSQLAVLIKSPFALSGPVERCTNASGSFAARRTTNSQPVPCHWFLIDPLGAQVWASGAPAATQNIVFGQTPGLYRIRAVPADPAETCTAEAEWQVRIAAPPPALGGIEGDSLICSGVPLTYRALSPSPGYSIQWTVQNGPGAPVTEKGDAVNVTWGAQPPYGLSAVQATPDGLACPSAPVVFSVKKLASVALQGPPSVCAGETANYLSLQNGPWDYQWSVQPPGAGVIASGQGSAAVEIFWQNAGAQQVTLNVCGVSAAAPTTVWATPQPQVVHPAGLCPGTTGPVQTTVPFATYVWANANGTALGSAAVPDLPSGNFSLTVTDANGCTGAAEFAIERYPLPNLSLTTADPTGFCNNSLFVNLKALTTADGDFKYDWFRDGTDLNAHAQNYVTNQYGKYTVRATNQFGCTAPAGPLLVFEYCGPGGPAACPNPPIECPASAVDIAVFPTAACDSFFFKAKTGPGYLAGTAEWRFGISGGQFLYSVTADNAGYRFPNAGQYIAFLFAELTNGKVCYTIDSVNVEAAAQFAPELHCAGSPSSFKDVSTFLPGATISAWAWSFGDAASGGNNSSALRSPGHTFSAAGDFPVQLTITAGSGCTSSATVQAPVPGGTPAGPFALKPGCIDRAFPFLAPANPDIIAYRWDFGDGSPALPGAEVFHRYNTPGAYVAGLTTTNTYGCTAVQTIPVNLLPNLLGGSITPPGPLKLCPGSGQTLQAPTAGATSYAWSAGNVSGPSLTAAATGIYDVTLTDANGCTYAAPPVDVKQMEPPKATIKALLFNDLGQVTGAVYPLLNACYGEDVRLIADGASNYTYQWSNGKTGSTILFSGAHGSVLPVGTHSFVVTVTDGNTGCKVVTQPFIVRVHPTPPAFTIAASDLCATGAPVTLSYGGATQSDWKYLWNTGEQGPALTTNYPGRYTLRIVTPFGCSAQSNEVLLRAGPNVAAIPAGCHTRCRPDTLCLPALPGVVSWQWFKDGTPVPGATSATFVAGQDGTYWAELTDNTGCAAQSDPLTLKLYDGVGDILGLVWVDVDHDGQISAADTLLSGIRVQLLQGGSPLEQALSNGSGSFAFAGLPAAGYVVRIDPAALPADWEIVIGQSPATLTGCGGKASVGLLLREACLTALTSTVQLAACTGASVLYNGISLSAGSSQTFPMTTAAGCDSLVTVNVVALPASAGVLNAKVCPGSTFDYGGAQIPAGASQTFVLQNHLGCDSVLTVNVATLPTSAGVLNAKVCPGSTFDYGGVQIPAGASQTFVLQNHLGCDSVLTVNVAALPTSAGVLNAKVCPGSTFDYGGVQIPAGASQVFFLKNYLGCDSVLTVNVAALPTSAGVLNAKVCPGSTFDYGGVQIPAGSSQVFFLQNYLGCDSVLTVNVAALPVSAGVLNAKVCPGSTFDYGGVQIPAGASQVFFLKNYLGCDSVLTVNVEALPVSFSSFTATVCAGETFTYENTVLQPGQTKDFILKNTQGCDSVVTVTVAALPPLSSALPVALCPGETFSYEGKTLQAGQSEVFTLQSALGCDSVVTVTVTALPGSSEIRNVEVCPGETYAYQGVELMPGQAQQFHFLNTVGCDSSISIVVSAFEPAVFDLSPVVSCADSASGSLTVLNPSGGLPPYRYSLDGLAFQDAAQFAALLPGDYTVWLEDSHGCVSRRDAAVGALPALTASLDGALLPCSGGGVTLQPVVGGYLAGLQYHWSTGAQSPSITATDPGPVWVDVRNVCETVRAEAEVAWEGIGKESYAYVPNVFAPAAIDSENSRFRPQFMPAAEVTDYTLAIYDRWGNQVFRTNDPAEGWEGPYRQQDMQPEVFVWYLKATIGYCGRGLPLEREGDVTVLR